MLISFLKWLSKILLYILIVLNCKKFEITCSIQNNVWYKMTRNLKFMIQNYARFKNEGKNLSG